MSDKFDTRAAEWREQIEDGLHSVIDGCAYPAEFKKILEYAVFPGGKRLRPILFLEWHSLYAPPDECALEFACGLELMHCFSLIHDDMPCVDNDDMRRGKPTVHKMFGEGKALLAGDALQDLSYFCMIDACRKAKNNNNYFALALRGDNGIIHGQYLDLYSECDSLDKLIEIYRKKTGALIDAACTIGYLFAQDPENARLDGARAMRTGGAMTFGNAFGIAFQLYDDLSEYVAGETSDGPSVLDFLDLSSAKVLLNKYLNDAISALDSGYDGDTSFLKELVEKFVIV